MLDAQSERVGQYISSLGFIDSSRAFFASPLPLAEQFDQRLNDQSKQLKSKIKERVEYFEPNMLQILYSAKQFDYQQFRINENQPPVITIITFHGEIEGKKAKVTVEVDDALEAKIRPFLEKDEDRMTTTVPGNARTALGNIVTAVDNVHMDKPLFRETSYITSNLSVEVEWDDTHSEKLDIITKKEDPWNESSYRWTGITKKGNIADSVILGYPDPINLQSDENCSLEVSRTFTNKFSLLTGLSRVNDEISYCYNPWKGGDLIFQATAEGRQYEGAINYEEVRRNKGWLFRWVETRTLAELKSGEAEQFLKQFQIEPNVDLAPDIHTAFDMALSAIPTNN